jgi:hypothetical protein
MQNDNSINFIFIQKFESLFQKVIQHHEPCGCHSFTNLKVCNIIDNDKILSEVKTMLQPDIMKMVYSVDDFVIKRYSYMCFFDESIKLYKLLVYLTSEIRNKTDPVVDLIFQIFIADFNFINKKFEVQNISRQHGFYEEFEEVQEIFENFVSKNFGLVAHENNVDNKTSRKKQNSTLSVITRMFTCSFGHDIN